MMRLTRFTWLCGLLAILGTLIGCAGKIDPILLDTSLRDAQNAISDARRSGVEDYAGEELEKATKLLQESRQAQRAGNGVQSLELAFQAQIEAQIAGALTRQRIAQGRMDEARREIVKTMVQEMEYKIQAAQTHRAIAEEREKRALARAERAEQRAITAQAEADEARRDAQNALFRSQTQLAIDNAQLVLDAAKEGGALTYAADGYQAAESLINQALSLLAQDKFDQSKAAAAQAEERANEVRIASVAAAGATQSAKLEDYTSAKVAIARAKIEVDRAEGVNAFVHAETLFQRAQTTLEQANMALKTEKYEGALQLAAQAESTAREAYAIAEGAEQERLATEAVEEQIAQAKDTIFKAEEGINREERTEVPNLAPELYTKAKALLADAKQALANTNYQRAVTSGQQSSENLTHAIEKAKRIEGIETRIINAAKAIPAAEIARTEKGVLIRFGGDLFEPGSAEINPKYQPMLRQLAEILKTFADYKVRIEGHSDSIGDAGRNLKLTKERANVFTKYLSGKGGVSAKGMTPVGLGEDYPIADNKSKAGRDKNRRIDTIILTREQETEGR